MNNYDTDTEYYAYDTAHEDEIEQQKWDEIAANEECCK